MSYQTGWNHPGAPNNMGGPFRPPNFPMQGGRGGPMPRGNFRGGHPGGFGFGNNGFPRTGGPGGPPMGFGPDNGFGGFNGPPMGQLAAPSKHEVYLAINSLYLYHGLNICYIIGYVSVLL